MAMAMVMVMAMSDGDLSGVGDGGGMLDSFSSLCLASYSNINVSIDYVIIRFILAKIDNIILAFLAKLELNNVFRLQGMSK